MEEDQGEKEAGITWDKVCGVPSSAYGEKWINLYYKPSIAYNGLHQGEQNLQDIVDSHVELTEIRNVRVYT